MICCDEERSSPFCPQCGKKLVQHDLHSLLAHIRSLEKTNGKQLERVRGIDAERPSRTPRVGKWEKIVSKWKAWGDELERLLRGES